ncbi:MAG: RIO1 family regulatory kinase/ATPase [Candidatus Bathyarchaeota archaeon]
MSSAEKAAQALPGLENYDLRVLQAIELGMIQHQIVPHDEVLRLSGLNVNEIDHRLDTLYKNELIYRERDPYLGYLMNYTAYDLLALNALVKAQVLEYLGPSIGVGKEADVFEGVTPEEKTVAVKFHRLGRTSFRETKRKREYLADRRHSSWLYQARLAAETEYEALQQMYRAGVKVPEPIHQNRHTVVMQYIKGTQLSDIISLEEPMLFLYEILDNMRKAYEAGIIHSDLSEYNILIDEESIAWIIDWPQYISSKHPNAGEILARDIGNVAHYFKRKYGTSMTLDEAVKYVKN